MKMSNIESLLSQVIGEGYEATASIFLDEEIDIKAFYSLDKETLKETGKFAILVILPNFAIWVILILR